MRRGDVGGGDTTVEGNRRGGEIRNGPKSTMHHIRHTLYLKYLFREEEIQKTDDGDAVEAPTSEKEEKEEVFQEEKEKCVDTKESVQGLRLYVL